ncbi:pleckstrin homology domain-containing family G member 4B-like [Anarhichas minor]|uniref:pleckstrin homology domain-containing family G member 4B-like n=1 Tax=Anarhichas minor TaxID=65739 RepID=UPI003F7319C2
MMTITVLCPSENLDSLESSIQNLLSVLYPPFEATAPTLLSQLFQIIDRRYRGDALRCLLDFLVPAKHILDTVQQAACAQYSDVLFLCEGWPLCIRDQVVVHLAPINPLLLQPGDFYLQVAPFCNQSARILVCSLLEEEGLIAEVVEETPIAETSYPCIFSRDWLEEINQGRHGTPLSQCLLATERGVVRLPWERVAVPDFVEVPLCAGSSMASAPPSYPPLPPPLPRPPPLPHFPENSSSNRSLPLSPSKTSSPKQYPVTIQNSTLASSSHHSAFSVETRICPARHGIAVSLRLVDASAASSSRLVKVKETESEPKPIGWVSPNTWDSCLTGTGPKKPCTPCMRRRQGGKASKSQELRCRYRDSYQAAIQNPVPFGQEKNRGNMLAVVEEDGDFSQCDERLPETETVDPWCNVQGTGFDPGMQHQFPPSVSGATSPQNRHESISDGRCSSLSTAVVHTSEKCALVIVEGQNIRRRENTGSCAEIPQLHVVKCKHSTAFGLVSPKINRRKMVIPDAAQPGSEFITSRNSHQMENPSQTDPPPATETQKIPQPPSTRPRPDHLPLGSPDPRAHPLYLGVASITGGRDRTGRAIVELYGHHQGWRSAVTSQELLQMLLYFRTVTRREVREAGLTLIFDSRRTNPQPQLYKALMMLQEQTPHAVNSFVLLVNKENSLRPERCPGIQTEVVTSMKALFKLVEVSQLSSRLDGTLSHSHCDWIELHQKLFPFVSDLHEASSLLLRAISKLEEPQRTDTVQTLQQCMMDQRTLMRNVLEDSRLVSLQREGGAILARLRKESDLKYPHCEDLSDAVDSVTSLYNHVEEQAHVLVQRSNMSLEHLEYLLQLREVEGHFMQMQQWFHVEGEHHLLEVESVNNSGDRMEQILNSFTGFLIEANDRRHHAMTLVSEAERLQQSGFPYPETEAFGTLVSTFKSGLEDILCRAEASGRELQIMVNVCDFCEQATALASECIEYLDQNQSRIHTMQDRDQTTTAVNQTNTQPIQHQNQDRRVSTASLCPSDNHAAHASGPTTTTSVLLSSNDNSVLQTFQDRFLQFSPERFQEVKAQASALQGSRGMQVWNIAWLRCQEARQQLQERMQDVEEVFQHQPDSSSWCELHYVDVVSTNVQTPSSGGQSLVVQSTPGPRHPQWGGIVTGAVDLGKRRPILGSNNTNSTTVACCNITPEDHSDAGTSQGSKWFPWGRGLGARSASQDSCTTRAATAGSSTPPEQRLRPPSSCSHHGQPSCRILQEAQKFQISRHGSFCSEESCMSDRGAAGCNGTSCGKHSSLPIGGYEGAFCLLVEICSVCVTRRLQRVLEELVFTEREYVRSLGYILTHYLPLLDRPDIPQDLRGKRGVIFGNLEKLYDFHSHYFLPELEACQREPGMVARCFLRHSESFGLYALYSKNKPLSDALILHRRHDIFKKKQQELGDMMDLSSYLLRPIQRISKYSLLLQDMLALCVSDRERERAEIQAAADLVRFQMRHGNDLLTMDAILECDVNLKEQGQLIRQDEFTVFFRKKKCVRRIFLFEDLILFSKTKRTDIGNDVYVYKQSFKTSDIGMTHNSSVSSLCFEIWFRRRKNEDTYTLKASSMEVKKAWTTDLERILWDQATHSRELRMQERVFMGMGRKPFMDIQPSDAAICDRAVSCALPGRMPVACCSHRVLDYPRPHSIGSGSTASTTLSQSSSSSGRGSLPPAGYPGNQSQGAEETSLAVCSSPEGSVSAFVDSTESSGECINVFSSSDRSYLSTIGGELVDDTSSIVSQSSKPHPPLCRTPSLRIDSSPVVTRKKPGVTPKPPHLANTQVQVKV